VSFIETLRRGLCRYVQLVFTESVLHILISRILLFSRSLPFYANFACNIIYYCVGIYNLRSDEIITKVLLAGNYLQKNCALQNFSVLSIAANR
jgi:CMP-2-keto-3-deoxyoctulosonic acid synthetase